MEVWIAWVVFTKPLKLYRDSILQYGPIPSKTGEHQWHKEWGCSLAQFCKFTTFGAFRLLDADPTLTTQSLWGAFRQRFSDAEDVQWGPDLEKAHTAFRQSDKSKQLFLGRTSCRIGCSTIWEGVLVLPGFELLQGCGSRYIIPTSAGLAWKKQLDMGNLCLYARRNRWILNNQTPPNTSNW